MSYTVAFAGKGGTGKTTVAGLLIKYLLHKSKTPILAVDADCNANLNEVLGLDIAETLGGAREDMKKGKVLAFAHGFNIHFGYIDPREDVNVIMIAPKGPGHLVRSTFEKGAGVPCLVAIHQDASGDALDIALAYEPIRF